jgi:hypothetical protein
MGHDSPHERRSTLARSFLRRVRRTGSRVVHTDIASTAAAKTELRRRTGAPPRPLTSQTYPRPSGSLDACTHTGTFASLHVHSAVKARHGAILPERDHGAGNQCTPGAPVSAPVACHRLDRRLRERAAQRPSSVIHLAGCVGVARPRRLWLVRGGLSTARVMCADCGEPLICVSRTARACVSYLVRRENAHDIPVHSSDMHASDARRRATTRGGDGTGGDGGRAARTRATPDHTYTDADSNALRAHRADGSPRHRATATAARRRRHLRRA